DLSDGPPARVCVIRMDSSRGDRLLVAAHHLVIDIVSWTILLEDLQRAYGQIRRGEEVKLPAVAAGDGSWCERLGAYAGGPEMGGEIDYWEKSVAGEDGRLPVDEPSGENLEGTAEELTVQLSVEQTEELLQEAGRAYQLQPGEVVLAALGRALGEWS